MDYTDLLAIIGASSGSFSLIINAINARREQLEAMRPKLNIHLTSDLQDGVIECHLEIQNVGTHELKMRSFRLFVNDTGFNSDFNIGLANYNSNLFISDGKILNKYYGIDRELTYTNLVETISELLKYDEEEVKRTISMEAFDALKRYYDGLSEFREQHKPLKPALFMRPFFLFDKNVQFYEELKKMPRETFPQGLDVILFDSTSYTESKVKKDPNALSPSTFRLIWEQNPAWAINNSKELNVYEKNHPIHKEYSCFELREDQAILSVGPSELGIPEQLAPMEKRSLNFHISCKSKTKFEVKVNLWVTSNQSRFLVLSKEITQNYHFVATPRRWLQAINI